jgi:hypothetical protein
LYKNADKARSGYTICVFAFALLLFASVLHLYPINFNPVQGKSNPQADSFTTIDEARIERYACLCFSAFVSSPHPLGATAAIIENLAQQFVDVLVAVKGFKPCGSHKTLAKLS